MILYQFLFTDCIPESAMATMSLHRTKAGAYRAMRKFIVDRYNKWYDDRLLLGIEIRWNDKINTISAWSIQPIEVEE